MDALYSTDCNRAKPSKDLQLTGVTCLFIASKNLEVEPLDMHTCKNTLLFRKYTQEQILDKEKDIRQAIHYVNEVPSTLDFLVFYHKLIKLNIQNMTNCTTDTQNFIADILQSAYEIIKSMMLDSSTYQFKPSILAAVAMFIGFQQTFYHMLMPDFKLEPLSLDISSHKSILRQSAQCFHAWEMTFNEFMPDVNFQQI